MAEAQTSSASRSRYFCHQCSDSIYPELPDFTCPRCQSGFIEEILNDEESSEALNQPAVQFAELWERTFLDSFREYGNDSSNSRAARVQLLPRRMGAQNPDAPGVEFIINHLLHTLSTGVIPGTAGLPFNLIHLHGNPGDYAWGADGLDSIVTQLLNQLEGSGPPPATVDQMEALPKRIITDADVAKVLQCSVCMEDYSKGEEVRSLPCNHAYHQDCIFPWLQRHGSCPVCRKDLEGKDTSTPDDVHMHENGFEENDVD